MTDSGHTRCLHQLWPAHVTVEELPRPIFVSCSNALRAHAVKVLCEAIQLGEDSEQCFARIATTKSKGLLKSPHIVQWLIASLDGPPKAQNPMILRQLYNRESRSFTYILGCAESRQGIIIDPVLDHHKRDLELVEDLNLHLQTAIDTHLHNDRRSGRGRRTNHAPRLS